LDKSSIEIIVASNGQEGIELFKKNPDIDLILMDIVMPVMGGYEATKIIREELNNKSVPIVALTGNVMQKDLEEVKKSDMQGHLAKPIDIDELKDVLDRYLNKNTVQKSSENREKKDLPTLDIQDSIRRFGGNEELYKSVLSDFHKKYKNVGFELASHYKARDFEAAQMLAHELKGVAGTVGAYEVHEIAQRLEDAFKSKSVDTKLIFQLASKYKSLSQEIEKFL
jgi:polar amino acid transport system substrate-binding protein